MNDRLRGDGVAAQGLPPEAELLLCCALAEPGGARLARAGELLDGALDWGRVARYALRHRLAPLLYVHLDAIGGGRVPPAVAEALRAHHHANARRNLRLAGELHLVLRAFGHAGIESAVLKGPALAEQADGSQALRTFRDLDLFVRPADGRRAGDVLRGRGYRLHRPFSAAMKDELFIRPSDGTVVELHRALGSPALPPLFAWEAVRGRLERVPVLGIPVPALPLEENLLFLAHHGAAHGWSRLAWLTAFAQLARRREAEVDWADLHARAGKMGMGRMLRLALRLGQELLHVALPAALADAVHRDGACAALAARIPADLFREAPSPSPRLAGGSGAEARAALAAATAWMQAAGRPAGAEAPSAAALLREPAAGFRTRMELAMGAGERVRDHVRFFASVAFHPHPADERAFRLPARLGFAYAVLRPARILFAHVLAGVPKKLFRQFLSRRPSRP